MTELEKIQYAGTGAKICLETMIDLLADSGTWCDIPEVAQFLRVYIEKNVNEVYHKRLFDRLKEIEK